MKLKLCLLFISSLLAFYASFAQKIIINGAETNRKLTWSDFTGNVDGSSPFWAYTTYIIKPRVEGIKIFDDSVSIDKFEVTLELDQEKS